MAIYKRCYFIFLIGALGYSLIEVLWRGYTHPSMALLGGFCLIMIYYVNKILLNLPRTAKAFICAILISIAELLCGILVNVVLKLNVWDYSNQPLNLLGQICPLYTLLWFCLSYIILYIIDKNRL